MPSDFPCIQGGVGEQVVLCLPGMFGHPEQWRPLMAALAAEFTLLCLGLPLDYRQGWLNPKAPDLEGLTAYVWEFMQAKGLEQVVLCGNSLGGQVAVHLCCRHPERVQALILTGSAGLFERSLAGGKFIRVDRQFVDQQAQLILSNTAVLADDYLDGIVNLLRDRRQRLFLVRLAKASSRFDLRLQLSGLHLPVLLVWGREDQITPLTVGEEFLARLPQAQLAVIDHCGHAPPLEQPAAFSQVVRDFLAQLPREESSPPRRPFSAKQENKFCEESSER